MFGRFEEWPKQEQMDFAAKYFTDRARERKAVRRKALRKGTGRIEIGKSKVLRIKDLRSTPKQSA